MSPSYWSRSLPIWSTLITVELFQSGLSSVAETTYFGMLLNLSANSPSRDGHASAKPSKVVRPSSSASADMTSSSLNWSPSGPRSYLNAQPPRSQSSDPPGSSITPSTDTNCETTILPMSPPSILVALMTAASAEPHRSPMRGPTVSTSGVGWSAHSGGSTPACSASMRPK